MLRNKSKAFVIFWLYFLIVPVILFRYFWLPPESNFLIVIFLLFFLLAFSGGWYSVFWTSLRKSFCWGGGGCFWGVRGESLLRKYCERHLPVSPLPPHVHPQAPSRRCWCCTYPFLRESAGVRPLKYCASHHRAQAVRLPSSWTSDWLMNSLTSTQSRRRPPNRWALSPCSQKQNAVRTNI